MRVCPTGQIAPHLQDMYGSQIVVNGQAQDSDGKTGNARTSTPHAPPSYDMQVAELMATLIPGDVHDEEGRDGAREQIR
jgi:hypothetical protein